MTPEGTRSLREAMIDDDDDVVIHKNKATVFMWKVLSLAGWIVSRVKKRTRGKERKKKKILPAEER